MTDELRQELRNLIAAAGALDGDLEGLRRLPALGAATALVELHKLHAKLAKVAKTLKAALASGKGRETG